MKMKFILKNNCFVVEMETVYLKNNLVFFWLKDESANCIFENNLFIG